MDPKTVVANRHDLLVLDVREDDEWTAGRIDGALHIPLGELDRRVSELDRNRPIVTVCRSGGRAGKAAEFLSGAGLNAHVMDGGMTQWAKDKLPFTTPDGRPGHLA
ncbi:MAG: rhodanese-like domain-containing protein [Actinomycetota bacterium]|nr:rhodanese-like domain-containing protein [Actinomycetota bacterium]